MAKNQSLVTSWVKRAAGETERIEACFSGLAYAPHSHDTYTLALTTAGVQSFNYRGELRHSLPGEVVILHPDEHEAWLRAPAEVGSTLLGPRQKLATETGV